MMSQIPKTSTVHALSVNFRRSIFTKEAVVSQVNVTNQSELCDSHLFWIIKYKYAPYP